MSSLNCDYKIQSYMHAYMQVRNEVSKIQLKELCKRWDVHVHVCQRNSTQRKHFLRTTYYVESASILILEVNGNQAGKVSLAN